MIAYRSRSPRGIFNSLRSRPFFSLPLRQIKSLTLIVVLIALSACTRVPAKTPQEAFRGVSAPSLHDDLGLAQLAQAIRYQIDALRRSPNKVMIFGSETRTHAAYASALQGLLTELNGPGSLNEKLEYIRENFLFFEIFGKDNWGEVLLTSYFEPVVSASKRPTARFSRALFAKPNDLLTIPLAQFSERFTEEKPLKGRLLESKIVPYYTRQEIDGEQLLRGRGLELAWIDPIDGFFLQIQGSGTVQYEDGSEDHLVYADKNGHRYEAIGRFLKDQIAPNPVTMQRIETLLRSMPPSARDEILFKNPSYVFFNKSRTRAVTALGVPATDGRTIATDPRFAPKGAVAFLEYMRPDFRSTGPTEEADPGFTHASRFVVDQDTGGAITGTGRVDLFWGRGDDAKKFAGVMQHPARLIYLVPR
jgi:membrane-bound lytic murein transglycosylase A